MSCNVMLHHLLGTLEVNLNKLPFPKKRQEDCDVDMLEDKSQMFDLFKAKYVKGWWSMAGKSKKTGILEQKVTFQDDPSNNRIFIVFYTKVISLVFLESFL